MTFDDPSNNLPPGVTLSDIEGPKEELDGQPYNPAQDWDTEPQFDP